MDLRGTTELTTQVHSYILVGRVARATMSGEPTIDEFERRMLARESGTVEVANEVISDKHVAGFTVKTSEALEARVVGGSLDNEGKIDGDPLVADSGTTRITGTTSMRMEFGRGTDMASLRRVGLMQGRGVPEVQVSKALMPQETPLIMGETVKHIPRGIGGV